MLSCASTTVSYFLFTDMCLEWKVANDSQGREEGEIGMHEHEGMTGPASKQDAGELSLPGHTLNWHKYLDIKTLQSSCAYEAVYS